MALPQLTIKTIRDLISKRTLRFKVLPQLLASTMTIISVHESLSNVSKELSPYLIIVTMPELRGWALTSLANTQPWDFLKQLIRFGDRP